jgi:hypothetical protein
MSESLADSSQLLEPPSRLGRLIKGSGWLLTGFFFLLFFTLLKLPDDRIAPFIDAKIQEQLRGTGMSYSAARTRLKIGLGLTYVLENATLNLPPPSGSYYFDKVSISPTFLSLLTGKLGADVEITGGKGVADLSVTANQSSQSVSFKLKDIAIGEFGKAPGSSEPPPPIDFMNPNPMTILANLKKSGSLSGSGSFSGNFAVPNSLDGQASLAINKLVLDQQSLMGFALPRMAVSESKAEVSIGKGKLLFKDVKLGKSPADDLRATLTGDMVLGKQWDTSVMNAKVTFSLSETVMKALVLIDALLAPGKQPDGSYSYTINGALNGPPVAAPAGK